MDTRSEGRLARVPWESVAVLTVITQWLIVLSLPPEVAPDTYHGTTVFVLSLVLLISALLMCLAPFRNEWSVWTLLTAVICLVIDLLMVYPLNSFVDVVFPNNDVVIYGDAIGCVIAAILMGPRWGMAVSIVRMLIAAGVEGPATLTVASVSIITAWCAGKFREMGGMTSIESTLVPGFLVGCLSVFMTTPLILKVSGSTLYAGQPDYSRLVQELQFQTIGLFTNNGASDPAEKALSFLLSYYVARTMYGFWQRHLAWRTHYCESTTQDPQPDSSESELDTTTKTKTEAPLRIRPNSQSLESAAVTTATEHVCYPPSFNK